MTIFFVGAAVNPRRKAERPRFYRLGNIGEGPECEVLNDLSIRDSLNVVRAVGISRPAGWGVYARDDEGSPWGWVGSLDERGFFVDANVMPDVSRGPIGVSRELVAG